MTEIDTYLYCDAEGFGNRRSGMVTQKITGGNSQLVADVNDLLYAERHTGWGRDLVHPTARGSLLTETLKRHVPRVDPALEPSICSNLVGLSVSEPACSRTIVPCRSPTPRNFLRPPCAGLGNAGLGGRFLVKSEGPVRGVRTEWHGVSQVQVKVHA